MYDWLRNNATPSRYKGLGELAHQARCTMIQLLLNSVPEPKKRKPKPHDAFAVLYHEGLQQHLDTAYNAMLKDATITKKVKKLTFRNFEVKRLYTASSAEVKKEVEDYRNKVVTEDLGEGLERFLYENEVNLDSSEKGRLAEARQAQM